MNTESVSVNKATIFISPDPKEYYRIAKKMFFRTSVTDILKAIRGESLMGAFTLSVCVIDAMAHLRNKLPGKNKIADNFEEWVKDYIIPNSAKCKSDILYALRCGLVHTYGFSDALGKCGVRDIEFVHDKPERHWEQPSANSYVLNLDSLVAEVIVGSFNAFDALIDDSLCVMCASGIEARIKELIMVRRSILSENSTPNDPLSGCEVAANSRLDLSSMLIPEKYVDMDRALTLLDSGNLEIEAIRREIQKIYPRSD